MFEEMSERDENNLRFLLTAPPDVMDQWWAQASPDDIEYAGTLLEMGRLLLIDKVVAQTGTEEAAQMLEDLRNKKVD